MFFSFFGLAGFCEPCAPVGALSQVVIFSPLSPEEWAKQEKGLRYCEFFADNSTAWVRTHQVTPWDETPKGAREVRILPRKWLSCSRDTPSWRHRRACLRRCTGPRVFYTHGEGHLRAIVALWRCGAGFATWERRLTSRIACRVRVRGCCCVRFLRRGLPRTHDHLSTRLCSLLMSA